MKKSERRTCNIDATMRRNVRRSWALGINPTDPKEVAAARKRHPGAEFDRFGRMVIHNRVEKLKRMKECEQAFGREMVEYNNRDL